MTLADKITSLRLILTPVFFLVYFLDRLFEGISKGASLWIVAALWVIFIAAELTDYFDGYFARKRGETSDFGRLFDPFADTLTQITLFLCFVIDGFLPAALFLVILYREFGILFLRNLMLKKGVVLGARMSGKVKTVSYIIAIGFALLASSVGRLFPGCDYLHLFEIVAKWIFLASVVISVYSFFDYVAVHGKNK